MKNILSFILFLISLNSFSQTWSTADYSRHNLSKYKFSEIDSIESRQIGLDLQKAGDLKTTSLVFKIAGSALVAGGAYWLANPSAPPDLDDITFKKGIIVIGSAFLVASIPLDFISASKTSRAGIRIQHLY